MDYRDVRVGQRVAITGMDSSFYEATVVEVDPRRIRGESSGDPVQVRLRLPITGAHTVWVSPAELTLKVQAPAEG